MMWKVFTAMMLMGAAAGCAAPAPSGAPQPSAAEPRQEGCNAESAQHLVGQKLSSVLVEEARRVTGAKSARVLRPGQAVTMEFNPFRVNVDVNRSELVTAIRCG